MIKITKKPIKKEFAFMYSCTNNPKNNKSYNLRESPSMFVYKCENMNSCALFYYQLNEKFHPYFAAKMVPLLIKMQRIFRNFLQIKREKNNRKFM